MPRLPSLAARARSAAPRLPRRALSAKAALPPLPYAYSALEPAISGHIMELHHQKHHNAYVTNFNAALEKHADAEKKGDIAQMVALQPALRFNGGGHINHSLFWTNLAPVKEGGGAPPTGELASLIAARWGSLDQFQTSFNAVTAAVQGSGWGWLSASLCLSLSLLPRSDALSLSLRAAPLHPQRGTRTPSSWRSSRWRTKTP
jgi:Fe-Mn family superoxide dismutase